jgi:hypothetical protein
MSKLKVDQISKATGASPAIFTLPAADGTVGQLMKTDGAGNLGFVGSAVGGKVLQVIQSVKTDTASTTVTTGTFADITGTDQDGSGSVFCVKITPAAATSKILVSWAFCVGSGATGQHVVLKLFRNAVEPLLGDAAGSRVRASSTIGVGEYRAIEEGGGQYLDEPSLTSEITYKLQWSQQAAGTIYMNRSGTEYDSTASERTASTITVMEIGA